MVKPAGLLVACAAACLIATPSLAVSFRYAGTTAPLTMDPHSTADFVTIALARQVYDSLVGLQDNMDIGPGLATEWTYQGNNTWRFKLRQGVKFDDGAAMTADDVVFSIMRQKTSPLYTSLFGDIKQAVAVDASTVDVISNSPDTTLPHKMVRLFVMSHAWATANGVEKVPNLGAQGTEAYSLRHADGTGPMVLEADDPGHTLTFKKNPNYWGDYPGNVDEAVYSAIGAGPTRVASLLSGELDLITDLPIQDTDRTKSAAGFKVEQVPQQLLMELEMDGSRDVALDTWDKNGAPLQANPFKDVRVRQAIADGIDANLIVQRVMMGQAVVVGTASVPGLAGYQKDIDVPWPYDPAKSKQLLTEAGYPDGFVTQLNCPLDLWVNAEETCDAVASMLARIGIDVKVKGIVWPEFARMLVNGPASSFHLIGTSFNSGDTQFSFTALMATRNKAKGRGETNWAMWSYPDFDAIVDQLVVTFDPAKRDELFRQGLEIGRDQVHAVYLYQPMLSWGMKQNVEVPVRPDDSVPLQKVVVK